MDGVGRSMAADCASIHTACEEGTSEEGTSEEGVEQR